MAHYRARKVKGQVQAEMIRPDRKRHFLAIAVTYALCAPALAFPTPALAIETSAKHAIIVDSATGAVLLERDADQPIPPASMSKLMTVYMVFERLKDGRNSLDDKFQVSRKAWRKGGSKMFVMVNSRVRLEDLLRGIIVQSGNDACIVVAEAIAGSEEKFAEQMTRRGREIGLRNSTFRNSTGWPEQDHLMSVRDIATLSRRLIEEFPGLYAMFAEKSFKYNGIRQGNRNPLLYREVGADGLKTGRTEAAGYGLAASAQRNGRRVVMVLAGLSSARKRAQESLRLIDIAFRRFANYALFGKGAVVAEAGVWLGKRNSVSLVADRDVRITLQRRMRDKLKVVVSYTGPIPAPIAKGAPIARLVVSAPEFPTLEIPLLAGEDIARLGPFNRIGPAIEYLLWGQPPTKR